MEGVELNGTTPTLMDGLVESQLTVMLSGVMGVVRFTCTATEPTEPSMSANTHNCYILGFQRRDFSPKNSLSMVFNDVH